MAKTNNFFNRIADKVLSARFLVTIFLAATLCYSVYKSFEIINVSASDPELLTFRKEIFMYVMGMFSGVVGSVIASYFSRTDRKTIAESQETTDTK